MDDFYNYHGGQKTKCKLLTISHKMFTNTIRL